jgi:hypothetical protein
MSKNKVNERKKKTTTKKKEVKEVKTPESSTRKMPNFLICLLNFFLAFAIGAIVIVIFFVFMAKVKFTDTFHLEFIIKAIISLVLSSMVLRVADKVSPSKGSYANGIPLALFTLFLCLFIWHFGFKTNPISVSDWDYGGFKKEEVREVEEETKEDFSDFQGENPYNHMTPSHVIEANKGEKSSWINLSKENQINIWSDGEYDIIYDNGREETSLKGRKEINDDDDGKIKLKFKKDNQKIYVYSQRL